VLKKYQCWDRVPQSVRDFLLKADPAYLFPTAEDKKQCSCIEFRVMGSEYLIEAGRKTAESLGLSTSILATTLNDIEAKPIGEFLANIAQEIEAFGRPFTPPCVLLVGGEAVVPIGKTTGRGGRNQELVLSAAPIIDGSANIVIGSIDSDGSDGPTDIAGGIVDGRTMTRLHKAGVDLDAELKNHNSGFVLETLKDTIYTGSTSTNMRDIRVIYVGGRKQN
jgi:glycerate-2-kinase